MSQRRSRGLGFCVFPGYNYCGPGCSGAGAPVNAVDAACKVHDECYRKFGPSCECDREFMRRLSREIDPYTQKGRHARIVYNYMKFQSFFTCGFRK